MILGYAGKLLEVDLSTERTRQVRLKDDVLKDYVGGRGLAAKILWDRLGENGKRQTRWDLKTYCSS